jgi:nitrogenase-associated protein
MQKVVFYQKTGSERDSGQRALLAAAGYDIDARDLTAEHWTPAALRAFFAERPVEEWFDPLSPRVASGEIDPARSNPQQALVMLTVDPALIAGPLVKVNGYCASALDDVELLAFVDVLARGGRPPTVYRQPASWSEGVGGE